MPRLLVPFFVQQPADQQLIEVFGLHDPDVCTVCRWHDLLGQLVLPDLSMRSPRPGYSWRATRRVIVTPPEFDYDVPTYDQFVADGNCPVCATTRLQEFYAEEQFRELFPTDDDGTEEERRSWEEHLFGPGPDLDEDGCPSLCPNCSQPW